MDARTVALIDDHRLVRAGLRNLIDNIDGFTVVAEASDGSETLGLVERYNPDVCLMDISMKDMSGLEALTVLKDSNVETKVIMLSMHESVEYVSQALKAGADGYLLKDSAEAELELALQYVTDDQLYVSPRVSFSMIKDALTSSDPETQEHVIPLTPRQQQILKLIAEGKATKEIAWLLDLSAKTVESHRAHIMERLQIRDVAGLVRYAFRHGLTKL